MEKEKPIIFDYRYDDEASAAPYQLALRRSGQPINNALLFQRLYALLESLYQPEREPVYFNDLAPALEYQYWRFWPRFAFVNELADQYEQAKKDGLLGSAPVNAYLDYWLAQKQTNSAIYEGTIRLSAIADGSIKFQRDIPAGTPYTYVPEPVNDLEAFQRLKFLMGPQVAEHYIAEFQQKYKEPTAEIYAAELGPINAFINYIDYAELKAAFERADNNYAHEYLRITQGYYENHRCEQGMGNTAAMVYGKYILYKKWLEDRLRESFKPKKNRGLPQLEPGKVSKDFVLGQELFNTLYQRGLLADFFLVPAPPLHGRFWYDIHDEDTDDPAKVVRVSPVSISQERRATPADFNTVFGQVNIIHDKSSKAYTHFVDDLIACLQQMIGYHRNLHQPHERDEKHYQLIELAEQFIQWLRSADICSQDPGDKAKTQKQPEGPVTLPVIALFCFYSGETVTRENSKRITKRYNPEQQGGKLYQYYSYYSSRENRIAPGDTKVTSLNKLKRLVKVIGMLAGHPEGLAHARRDLEDFKRNTGLD